MVEVFASQENFTYVSRFRAGATSQLPENGRYSNSEIAKDTRPVVNVCRSGARSAQAVAILQRAGFRDVANLAGGMLRWRADGHGVEGGRE